jgi:hypothetical protein
MIAFLEISLFCVIAYYIIKIIGSINAKHEAAQAEKHRQDNTNNV